MSKQWYLMLLILGLTGLSDFNRATPQQVGPQEAPVSLISVNELKEKLSNNAPVAIIDVRATNGYADSSGKIKGAIHVKLRRLKARLGYPPLKNISRDTEVVTYCACPTEEASIHAARILIEGGFKHVRALKGGWQEWLKINGQTESRPKGM